MKININKNCLIYGTVILLAIVVAIFIGIMVFKISNNSGKKIENEELTLEETLPNLLSTINDINKELFNMDNLSEGTKYTNVVGFSCYKYNGGKQDEMKSKIDDVYHSPYGEYKMFDIITSTSNETNESKEVLYVCLPESCTSTAINDNMYEITSVDDSQLITIYGSTYAIEKKDGKWKLRSPIILCNEKVTKWNEFLKQQNQSSEN